MRPLALALLFGGCTCAADVVPEVPEDAKRKSRSQGDPLTDPESSVSVDPPAGEIARIAPTPRSEGKPAAPVKAPTTPPNVVVVIGCTVRKDQMSVYGAPENTTPFLSAMAAQGTVFDDLIAAAPWTRAASTALLTGRHALSIGMVEPGQGRDDSKLPDDVTTLAERFRDLGYATIGGTANPNLSATFGFDQGFEAYQLGLDDSWRGKLRGKRLAEASIAAVHALRAGGDARPIYLRLMMLDAHEPRSASGDALVPYAQEGVPARVARYRVHLRELDDALATLDAGLAAEGLTPENTVFLFVADHGEGMNYPSHHGFGHGQYFGSSSVHVPWILRGPGVAVGHRVLGPASQVDVMPTLLGVVGQPVNDPALEGQDWSALVRGDGSGIPRPYVISDTWFGGSSRAAIFTADRQCQADFGSVERQQKKGKFVPGCYDRIEDPLFTRPLAEEADLMAILTTWRTAGTTALATRPKARATVDAGLAKELEALGYVDRKGPGSK